VDLLLPRQASEANVVDEQADRLINLHNFYFGTLPELRWTTLWKNPTGIPAAVKIRSLFSSKLVDFTAHLHDTTSIPKSEWLA
jgi:hypothetical protein